MPHATQRSASAILLAAAFGSAVFGGDWTNNGGNAGRNGRSLEVGPEAPQVLWSGGAGSIIAWQPVTEGNRVFMVRQTGFPPGGEPNGSPVKSYDLTTGAPLWSVDIPYNAGDWTTWVAGVSHGRVFASRSGNGASVSAHLYALDAATGATLWVSQDTIDAGAYDGVVFTDGGDPVVASFTTIKRIRGVDGVTLWSSPRTCSVSGECGAALRGNAVYVVDAAAGGDRVKRFDLGTGGFVHQGPVMSGFTLQNTPMVGPDGTIYLSRTQNNVATDFFYAFQDTGAAITTKWSVPAAWTTTSEFAVNFDGSVLMLVPGNMLARLDPQTGATLQTTAPIMTGGGAPRIAVDLLGRIFLSNGAYTGSQGMLFSYNADLSPRWSVPVPNVNIGTPCLGRNGVLVVAAVGGNITAYHTPRTLDVDTASLSAAAGGSQTFSLNAGPTFAGSVYVLAGSATGTLPGTSVGSVVAPIDVDAYTLYVLSNPNAFPISGSLGTLDGQGQGTATFSLPSGLAIPGLPLVLYHAFVALDAGGAVAFASNPVALTIAP